MGEKDLEFKEKVKSSFSKVKEAINNLENEIKLLKDVINSKNNEINYLKEKINILSENSVLKPILDDKNMSSTRNDGVYANMQTFMQTHKHIPKHKIDIKSDIEAVFNRLTKQEFLIFLTIYQQEEEKHTVTYNIISHYLKLSTGCIRTHITNLLRKGAPIIKTKINNKILILGINNDFKALNLKQALINMYYQIDSSQATLI